LVLTVAFGAAFDVGTRRIPNFITIGGLAVALVLRLSIGGVETLLSGLLGALLAFLFSFPLFMLKGMGGGDVKLLTAVGAFLGPFGTFVALLATALVGGVLAIAVSLRRRRLGSSLAGTFLVMRGLALKAISGGEVDAVPTLETQDAVTVPYGVAIAVGAVIGLLWWTLKLCEPDNHVEKQDNWPCVVDGCSS
jgi:prepilin peptidase CpaA